MRLGRAELEAVPAVTLPRHEAHATRHGASRLIATASQPRHSPSVGVPPRLRTSVSCWKVGFHRRSPDMYCLHSSYIHSTAGRLLLAAPPAWSAVASRTENSGARRR
eukprot:2606650-Prymnesium_polylepis.1